MTPRPTTTTGQTVHTAEVLEIIEGRADVDTIHDFLAVRSPELVRSTLLDVLPPDVGEVTCSLTRSRVTPGKKITAFYTVDVAGFTPRPAAVTWAAPGTSPTKKLTAASLTAASDAIPAIEREPFRSLFLGLEEARTSIMLAPLDPGFPQLVRLYDRDYLARLLRTVEHDAFDADLMVEPLRYRPGQRHVLRVDSADGSHRLYAKSYKDDTGIRAVESARDIGAALEASDCPARAAVPYAYVAADRLALWSDTGGVPLSDLVAHDATLATATGAALRVLHDADLPARITAGVGRGSVIDKEAASTTRAVRHVGVLRPDAGVRLAGLLDTAERSLAALPQETGHLLHGDFKADNILVNDGVLHLLDFDRVTTGDPALDLGKFFADLRWWAISAGTDADALIAAFVEGYGPCDAVRLVRARHYDTIFQLRAVGRRVSLHRPGWHAQVDAFLDHAAASATGA